METSARNYGIRADGSDVSAQLAKIFSEIDYGTTITFEPGRYGIGEPVRIPSRNADSSGLTISGSRGAIFQPVSRIDAMFELSGDQVDIRGLRFDNTNNLAQCAFKIEGDGTNNRRTRFDGNEFARFEWAIESSAADLVDTSYNNCVACRSGFIRFASNGMSSTHFGNYILGGKHGFYFTHGDKRTTLDGQPAEGVRILSNTILCTAPESQAILIHGGLEVHVENNIIDQTGQGGIGVALMATPRHGVFGIKIGTNWIASGASGAAIQSRGPVQGLRIGSVTLAGKAKDEDTIGLDMQGAQDFLLDGAMTVGISGLAARFSKCTGGVIRGTDFRAGAGVNEDAECSLMWIGGNRTLPSQETRSSNSIYEFNFEAKTEK